MPAAVLQGGCRTVEEGNIKHMNCVQMISVEQGTAGLVPDWDKYQQSRMDPVHPAS
jgi:hypothetical protein